MTLKNANWINEAWADFIQKIRALMNTRAVLALKSPIINQFNLKGCVTN